MMSLIPMRGIHTANIATQNVARQASWRAFMLPWLLLAGSWGLLGLAFLTGKNSWLDHDYLIRSSRWSWLLALLVFLAGWQVMLLAMMLPALFGRLLLLPHSLSRYWSTQTLFIAGYAASWTLFACAAFVGDTLLHSLVNQWRWLYLHPQWITALLFFLAGLFQWSAVKWRCLQHTRDNEQNATGPPWQQGYRYGLWCMGCNWALMLLMIGVGMRNLLTLAVLALFMWLERAVPQAKTLSFCAGSACLLYALLILLLPLF